MRGMVVAIFTTKNSQSALGKKSLRPFVFPPPCTLWLKVILQIIRYMQVKKLIKTISFKINRFGYYKLLYAVQLSH